MGSASNTSSSISDNTASVPSASMASALSSSRSSSGQTSPGPTRRKRLLISSGNSTPPRQRWQHNTGAPETSNCNHDLPSASRHPANRTANDPLLVASTSARRGISPSSTRRSSTPPLRANSRQSRTVPTIESDTARRSHDKTVDVIMPGPVFSSPQHGAPACSRIHFPLSQRAFGTPADTLRNRRTGCRRVALAGRAPSCHRHAPLRSQGSSGHATLPGRTDHRLRPGSRPRR